MRIRTLPSTVVIGGIAGFVVYSVDAIATAIRYFLHPTVAERVTAGAFPAMVLYLPVFVAAGALAGMLWRVRARLPRYVLIGALAGAVVWSYLTVTWSLTARPTAFMAPDMGVLQAVLLGAGSGGFGGLLLFAVDGIRRLFQG